MKLTYAVVVEQTPNNYAAYAPEVPGCISTAKTRDEMLVMIREALTIHIEFLIEGGDPVPEPTMSINDAIAYHSKALAKAAEEEPAEPEDTLITLSTTFCIVEIEVSAHNHMHTTTRGLLPEAAYTAGLAPATRFKPSGVEWIGDVPESWDVRPLIRSVFRSDEKVESDEASGLPYVGLEHVESWTGRLLPLDDQVTPESISNFFMPGSVLFSKLRPYLAKAFCPDFEGLCSTEFLVLSPLDYDQGYLLYLMLTDGFVSQVDSSTYGAKMPRASWKFVGSCLLPLPPLNEQKAIADYLNQETERIDTLVAKQQLLIKRLEEYRAALITQTVTRGLPQLSASAPPPK